MARKAFTHHQVEVYKSAFEAAMDIFRASMLFLKEEKYSLVDQIRRSSRSVCASLAEAWRRRRYEAAFINKVSEAEGEAAETQVWIEFAVRCEYLSNDKARPLYRTYNRILGILVGMITHSQTWILPAPKKKPK
jgi:four helix bundle protein